MKRKNPIKELNNAGFTLSELMVVIIIIGLLTATIAGGIPSVVNAFRKITRTANAQTIMSTAVNEIKGDLRYARTSELVNDEKIFYSSEGYLMTYKNASDNSGIYRVYYKGTDKTEGDSESTVNPEDTDTGNYTAERLLTERDQATGLGQENNQMVAKIDRDSFGPMKDDNGKILTDSNGRILGYQFKITVVNKDDKNSKALVEQTVKVRALNE